MVQPQSCCLINSYFFLYFLQLCSYIFCSCVLCSLMIYLFENPSKIFSSQTKQFLTKTTLNQEYGIVCSSPSSVINSPWSSYGELGFSLLFSCSIIHNPVTSLNTDAVIIDLNVCLPLKRGWFCSSLLGVLSTWSCGWRVIHAQQLSVIKLSVNKLPTMWSTSHLAILVCSLLGREAEQRVLKFQLLLKFHH